MAFRRSTAEKTDRQARLEAARARRREALAGGQGGSGIHWQADTNPLNMQRSERYAATNGLPRDHPGYTVAHITHWHGDSRWYTRIWVGPNQDVEAEYPSFQEARSAAEATLTAPPPSGPVADPASWVAAATTRGQQQTGGQCGAKTQDGTRCRNGAGCPIPSHRRLR